jgi:Tfp pilus assembly protein PilX
LVVSSVGGWRLSLVVGGARGFALVTTVMLLVLVSLLAMGLLTLSAIALRQSGAGADQAEARSNARLALVLAIGQLQEHLGPDMRVCATADQIRGEDADATGAAATRRRWTGAAVSDVAGVRDSVAVGPARCGDQRVGARQPAGRAAAAGRDAWGASGRWRGSG